MTRLILLVVIGHALLALALMAWPAKAHAHCPCGSYVTWSDAAYSPVRRCYRCRYQPRVYSYSRRWDDERQHDRRDQCLETEVNVLSTEHQSEDNARESARKLWMATTQWKYGGQYMNLDEAAHVRWQCGPSSAMDTISGRISEAAGALTGKGGQNVRCALWAHPCRTERTLGDERRRP